ncbi:MAG: DUF2262 domain-containing protein [Paracoccaceae bacterium]
MSVGAFGDGLRIDTDVGFADLAAVAQCAKFCQSHIKSWSRELLLKQVRDWLRGIGSPTKAATVVFVDPVLGPMEEDQRIKGRLVSHIRLEDRNIELSIDPDGEPLEECVEAAQFLYNSLINIDQKARSVASRDLLNEYNESWRSFGVTYKDGTTKEIENPALTPDEFEATILLHSVNVTGTMLEFRYSDKGLFAGHSIIVQAFDGVSFKDTHATLFG